MRRLIPLYADVDSPEWARLLRSVSRGDVVIVNPDSGPGDGRQAAKWDVLAVRLEVLGVYVLAYVAGRNRATALKAYAQSYRVLGRAGFFFDEYSPAKVDGAEKLVTAGQVLAINPGVQLSPAVRRGTRASIIVSHETAGMPGRAVDKLRDAAICFDVDPAKGMATLSRLGYSAGICYRAKESGLIFDKLP